jgi:DNA-binding NarL/FixJ family response regulator
MLIVQPRRILCVTNQKVLTACLPARLEKEGIEILSTDTAAEGYELARDQRFTLFLFGDRLRTGSGIELYRRVRIFDERTPTVIVISNSLKGQIEKARALKAQIVSSTQVNADLLLEIIRKLISNIEKPLPRILAAAGGPSKHFRPPKKGSSENPTL